MLRPGLELVHLPQRLLRLLLAAEPTRKCPDRGLGTSSGPIAKMLLSGADIGGSVDRKRVPSPSSSGQSPISEPNDWTLRFGRRPGREGGKSKEGGKTGFGSALCSASAGSKARRA